VDLSGGKVYVLQRLDNEVLSPADYIRLKLWDANVSQSYLRQEIDIAAKRRGEEGFSATHVSRVIAGRDPVNAKFIERLCWVNEKLRLKINRVLSLRKIPP
jgi:hypothetical protein